MSNTNHSLTRGSIAAKAAALLTAAVISGTGFLGFLASPFIPLRHFGLLISGALWLAILCDMLLLPLLLLSWKRS